MNTETNNAAKTFFTTIGEYAIRWAKDGKSKTVTRWFNTAEELDGLIGTWSRMGYEIVSVTWLGR